MVDEIGWNDKAKFIKAVLFKKEIKYVKLDKAAMDYYMRLTTFYSQFWAIGVNYNQVVKHLKAAFTEKMALALLYKLEKATVELVTLNRKIEELTREFECKYLLKQWESDKNQYLCLKYIDVETGEPKSGFVIKKYFECEK